MWKALAAAVLVGVAALFPAAAWADLFDRIVDDFVNDSGSRRSYMVGEGSNMSGGAVVQFPVRIQQSGSNFRVKSPCGSWSLTPQGVLGNLTEMLDPDRLKAALMAAIQNSIQNLVGAVVSKLSMLTVCYAVPTLCDLTKHMQAVAGQLHNVRSLSCQQLEGLVGSLGSKLSAGRTAKCVQGQIGAGMSLNVAQRMCASGEWTGTPANPGVQQGWGLFGDAGGATTGQAFPDEPMSDTLGAPADPPGTRTRQNIVRDTLKRALKDSTMSNDEKLELLEFQELVVGDLTVKDSRDATAEDTDAPPGDDEASETEIKPEMPEYKLADYYRSTFDRMAQVLDCAVDEVGGEEDPSAAVTAGGCASVSYEGIDGSTKTASYADGMALVQELSAPGVAVPRQGLEALHSMKERHLTARYEGYLGKVAGSLALTRTVWITQQLVDELETGMMGTEDQGEEERQQIEMRLYRLQREAKRMVQARRDAEEFVIPTFHAVLADQAVREAGLVREVQRLDEDHQGQGIFSGVELPYGYEW